MVGWRVDEQHGAGPGRLGTRHHVREMAAAEADVLSRSDQRDVARGEADERLARVGRLPEAVVDESTAPATPAMVGDRAVLRQSGAPWSAGAGEVTRKVAGGGTREL